MSRKNLLILFSDRVEVRFLAVLNDDMILEDLKELFSLSAIAHRTFGSLRTILIPALNH